MLPNTIHSSWKGLEPIFETEEMLKLNATLSKEDSYFPHSSRIFRVFSVPLPQVRLVILGQDPYPTPNKAIGRAFAIDQGCTKIPVSLKIIEEEVGGPIDYTLQSWEDQGVLLLNTALTVEKYQPGSHLKYWKNFSIFTIDHISKAKPCIWFLWGSKAQQFEPYIHNHKIVPNNFKGFTVDDPIANYYGHNLILKAPHPAAEAYSGGKAGYLKSNHFNIVNHFLNPQIKFIHE